MHLFPKLKNRTWYEMIKCYTLVVSSFFWVDLTPKLLVWNSIPPSIKQIEGKKTKDRAFRKLIKNYPVDFNTDVWL